MDKKKILELVKELGITFRTHPWHGIDIQTDDDSNVINVYIEIVPDDTVKYELDKASGYLKVDRPQKFSNIIPSLYGFVPKTYCGDKLAQYTAQKLERPELVGDGDPLDICVLTEKHISHGDLLVSAIPIGGFRMIDHGEVDDKIIAVLKNDAVFGGILDIKDCPDGSLSRLKHYFLTYKQIPGEDTTLCEIAETYGREEALKVIALSSEDYNDMF